MSTICMEKHTTDSSPSTYYRPIIATYYHNSPPSTLIRCGDNLPTFEPKNRRISNQNMLRLLPKSWSSTIKYVNLDFGLSTLDLWGKPCTHDRPWALLVPTRCSSRHKECDMLHLFSRDTWFSSKGYIIESSSLVVYKSSPPTSQWKTQTGK